MRHYNKISSCENVDSEIHGYKHGVLLLICQTLVIICSIGRHHKIISEDY